MKSKLVIGLVLILGLFVLIGVAHAQTPEKFWAVSVGNIHILDGISPFGAFQWRGEIVGTDIINLVDTYVQVGSWRDNFNPAWQLDNRSWFSISLLEVRVLANAEFDDFRQLWDSIILDPPGMLWFRNPIFVGDSWPISATGMLTAGALPLGIEVLNIPITVTGTGSVLAAEAVTTPMGTYRAYKIQHQIEIRDQSNNIIEAFTEQDWLVPYLGSVKWADAQSTELLSSLTLPFIFSDIPLNNWAYHYTAGIYDDGITQGTATGVYSPLMNVTREQMAAFIVRAVMDGQFFEGPCTPDPSPFSDVPPTSPYCRNIKQLFALGITQGTATGVYSPLMNVTREQMAAFIVRAVENSQFFEGVCTSPPTFSDVDQNSIYCKNIERLVARGITLGCGDGTTYCPGNNVLRDQMAAFLARAFLGMP